MTFRWPWMAATILLSATSIARADSATDIAPPTDDLWSMLDESRTADATTVTPVETPSATSGNPATPDAESARGRTLVRHGGSHATKAVAQSSGTAPARDAGWVKTSLALAGVIGAIVLLAYGYRTLSNKAGTLPFAFRGRYPGVLEVVGRTTLSAKHSLCLVRIGPRLILVGLGGDGVRTLDVVENGELVSQLLGAGQSRTGASSKAAFEKCLETEEREYDESDARPDTPPRQSTPQERLLALIRQVSGSMAKGGAR